jgi:chromatin segregation and condensation protein Rec8/ScpA/Scc1 (kleisin family)
MMDYLREQLRCGDRVMDGGALLERQPTASRRACLFLGMLEMVRDRSVEVQQNEAFGTILVRGIGIR